MHNAVFKFEMRYWLKSPLFYGVLGCFFLLSLVSMLGTGGFFDAPVSATEKVTYLNTPFAFSAISFLFSKFALFAVAIFASYGLYRDYQNNTHPILYTFPFTKLYYLKGKLLSAYFPIAILGILVFCGFGMAEAMLGIENPKITKFNFGAYATAFGIYFLPNLIIAGNLVFTIIGFTRNIFAAFAVVVVFVLLQNIVANTLFNVEMVLSLLDPFGEYAFANATKDWVFSVQNSNTLPIDIRVFYNRLFWLGLSSFSVFLFYTKFNFQYNAPWYVKKKQAKENHNNLQTANIATTIVFNFSWKAQLKAFFLLLRFDFLSILKSWIFLILCLFGVLTVLFVLLRVTNTGEFIVLPLTRIVIGAPLSLYSLIVMFSTFLFSGVLVHKARKSKMNCLIDVSPVKNGQLFGASVGAVALMQVCQLLFFMVVGISIQLFNGYYHVEVGLYLFQLFVLTFPTLLIWNVCSYFIHALFPNLFLGLFVLLGIWLGVQSLEQLGIHTSLLKFNVLPVLSYSDFYGFSHQIQGYFLLLCYWLVFTLILGIGIYLLWHRGSLLAFTERFKLLKKRLNRSLLFFLILPAGLLLFLGMKIIEEETQAKAFEENKEYFDTYKAEWSRYQDLVLPKIKNVALSLTIHPKNQSFTAKGTYTIVNEGNVAIDSILVRTGFDESTQLQWEEDVFLLKEDTIMRSKLYQLQESLLPNDTLYLNFEIQNKANSIFSRNSNVLENGTYLGTDMLPRLGYQFITHELPLRDSSLHQFNYFHRDADWVTVQTEITTAKNQLAIAPGSLIAKQTLGDSTIFTYKTESPVKFNFSFHSAEFETITERYNEVDIALNLVKSHTVNTEFMLSGIKAAVDFNQTFFEKYPHQQIKIVEFPHTEASYSATLTANVIPTSEQLFIMNTEVMEGEINLPFYVMAHELTHQWFGNNVMPADAEGAKMLTESITEYLSLLMYKKQFGEEMAKRFLDVQLQRYKQGKRNATDEERPLYRVLKHQEYIAYGKGAIAFYLLGKRIGEEKLLGVLKEYVETYGNRPAHFPTTLDFLSLLKQNVEEVQHPFINELFMETTDFEDYLRR